MKPHLRSQLPQELEHALALIGEPAYRAKQIFGWCARGVSSVQEMTNLPKALRTWLEQEYLLTGPDILHKLVSRKDGTVKYLFGLADGNAVESVLMRYEHGVSLCISSQVGCRMGCTFCASTEGGLVRNLEAGELLDQVLFAGLNSDLRIDSVVLMGIGEPLDNYDNVVRFLRLIHHEDGLNLSMRNISISTCGLVDRIDRLAQEGLAVTLSISLHAPNDALRGDMMPVNQAHSVAQVVASGRRYATQTGRKVYFEYTMMNGKNDTVQLAEQLGALLQGMLCHVNLIALNPVEGKEGKPSNRKAIDAFSKTLARYGVSSTLRRKLGGDIEAACGQLRRGFARDGGAQEGRPAAGRQPKP